MSGTWVVLGAGGHGAVVADTLELCRQRLVGFCDDHMVGSGPGGLPVLGSLEQIPLICVRYAIDSAAYGIGDNRQRKIRSAGVPASITRPPVIHPSAAISPKAEIGAGVYIGPHAVVNAFATVGAGTIVNTGATIDHHCRIENWSHICPGAHLAGNVAVGEGALVGTGACAKPGMSIGPWSVVGAGAVVVKDIPAGCTAVGCPARPIHRVDRRAADE